ncbi:hypothetical protein N0V85_000948 [Neurospora sp. IMI 360204]|nr:hypothetical protein N0V85_000948 [Neurospora sp. IMI 360204]
MILSNFQAQRPLRIISVLAVLGCLWLWLITFHNSSFTSGAISSEVPLHGAPKSEPQQPNNINNGIQNVDHSVPAGSGSDAPTANTPPPATNQPAEHEQPPVMKTSRVAKVTVAANALDVDVIHRAMQTHERHNREHGYPHYIALNQAVSSLIENDRAGRPKGAWTKPAYLLSIIVAELEKPEEERLKWVFWFDADTVVMNPYTPLELFLPPEDAKGLSNVDLVISSNWDGLNSGVFAFRVSPWSVSFLSAVLAYPIYNSERMKTDRFRDQSAFQFLLTDKASPLAQTPMAGRDHWVNVPIRWFNSLPVNNAFFKNGTWLFGKEMVEEQFDKGTNEVYDDGHGGEVQEWKVMQGDMIVHFAGTSYVRDSWMGPWVTRAEQELPEWANKTTKDVLKVEVDKFWYEQNKKLTKERAASAIEEEKKKKEQERKDKEEKARKEREKKEKEAKAKKEKEEQERKAKEETSVGGH